MFAKRFILILVLTLAAGCAGNGNKPKTATQKEKAHQSWNNARAGVLYSLGKQQLETGNLDSCRKTLDEAARLAPESAPIRLLSARQFIEQGRLEHALRELDEVEKLDPHAAECDYLRGVVFQRWQKPQQAHEAYTRAAEKAPTELHYLMALSEMLVNLDRPEEALATLQEKLGYFENSAAIRDAVGQLLVQQRQYAKAVVVLRQASILAPDEVNIREHLALALYYAGEYRDAAVLLERLTKDDRYATRVDFLTALGQCQLHLDRLRDARDNFQLAAQLQPAVTSTWLNLAKVALKLDDPRRAELSLRKAMTIDPQSGEVNLMFGYLRLHEKRHDDALSYFRKASALDPSDPVGLCMCGYVLEKLGQPREALACYAQALKLKPRDELASTLLAQLALE